VVEGVTLDRLEAGTVIVVNTQNSRYRLVILLEPRVVLVTGGEMFPVATVLRFAGSASLAGGLKEGWIEVGGHMQMWLDTVWIVSSMVRSVSIESVPTGAVSGSH